MNDLNEKLFEAWGKKANKKFGTSTQVLIEIHNLLAQDEVEATALLEGAAKCERQGDFWKPSRWAKMLKIKGRDTTKLGEMLRVAATHEPVVLAPAPVDPGQPLATGSPFVVEDTPVEPVFPVAEEKPSKFSFLGKKNKVAKAKTPASAGGKGLLGKLMGMVPTMTKKGTKAKAGDLGTNPMGDVPADMMSGGSPFDTGMPGMASDSPGVSKKTPLGQGLGNNKMLVWGGLGLVVIVVIGLVIFLASQGGSSAAYDTAMFDSPSDGTPSARTSAGQSSEMNFWSNLKSEQVPERSPGILGFQTATTAVGIVLMIVLSLWAWSEGSVRNNGQKGALFFSILSVITGWITLPILNFLAGTTVVGWFVVGFVLLAVLWALSASTIWSQTDKTPITITLALFVSSLFYSGKLTVISAIGTLFNLTWPAWTGITTMSGMITLLMTGRFLEATLTIFVLILSAVVIAFSIMEVGKKHGHTASITIGVIIIVLFLVSNWGLNSFVAWLIATQGLSVFVSVIFKVVAPILAWVISLFASVMIGVFMGDIQVGFTENRQNLGIQKSGGYLQNIADFAILGTVIPLILGVIIVFF